ncbi:MAG: nitroreductase family protein [Halobacteria archaeon]|nr:nitroreductase family protein [Halobacteria archaeon]
METREAIETRRSVRNYEDGEITDEQLRELFDAVRWAPSSYNLQPWEFLVVRDDENKERLKECAYGQEQVTEASAVVVVFGDTDRGRRARTVFFDQYEKGYRSEERAEELVETMETESRDNEAWAKQNATIAATTLLYAARDMGLASCPMGGWDADAIVKEFDVPSALVPVLMVTLGYPDDEAFERERKYRRSTDDIVHLEDLDSFDFETSQE